MKTGLSLEQMATELDRQADSKRDFIADTRHIAVSESAGIAIALGETHAEFGSNHIFRRQLAEHFKIPADYSERLLSNDLLRPLYAKTYNTFLQKFPSKQMVRTLDGKARAFRSDRFRALDNYELAQAVLPVAMSQPEMRVESSQFTDSRFYMKLVFPKLETEVKKGDVVQMGLSISNSEVGMGSLSVEPLIYRLVCLNGMIMPDYGVKRYHVGKKAETLDFAYEMYSDKTKQLEDATLFAKIRDTVKGLLSRDIFETVVSRMRETTEQQIEGTNIVNVVEVTAKKFGYGEGTKQGILKHLIMGQDLSRYGLLNAITRQSQDEENYDTATQLEKDGARVIELARSDWKQIADAALA